MYLLNHKCSQLTIILLLYLFSSCVYSEDYIDYETAHQLAINAFEVLSPFAASYNNTPFSQVSNDVVDKAIERLRAIISSENMDQVRIPDFTESFQKDIGFIKLRGSFKGKNGWVESLLSITRRGETRIKVDGTALVLDAHLGLDKLNLGMKFQVELLGVNPGEGTIRGHVRSNDVKLNAAMDFATGECKLKLRAFKINELGKIDVEVTGYGELNWLATQIGTWVTDQAHARITEAVNDVLANMLSEELKKEKCPNL